MRRPNYDLETVRGLIENYAEIAERVDTSRRGLRWFVLLADLNTALEQLPDRYWEVVLLHGLIGLPQRETGVLLQVSQQAVAKRYRRAVEETHYYINGGVD